MADAAKVHEDVFKEVGLPDDFVEAMLSAAHGIAESIDERNQHAGRRNGATAGLKAEEARGRSMIRLIDAIVTPKLGSNDALLAQWKAARRVARKPGPVATTTLPVSAPPVSPAPVPVATPAAA
jgi:hypothetical protein